MMKSHFSHSGFSRLLIIVGITFLASAVSADNHVSHGADSRPTSAPTSQPVAAEKALEKAAETAPTPKADDRPSTGPTRIIVKWVAETAVDNFGYNVYRADEMTSAPYWKKLNKRVLPGIGTTSEPTVMRYIDRTVGPDLDRIWYYKVQEISTDGGKSYFSHPVTGETPFILRGKPKVIKPSEEERFADTPFHVERLER